MNDDPILGLVLYTMIAVLLLLEFILPAAGIVFGVVQAKRRSAPQWYLLSAVCLFFLIVCTVHALTAQ